MVNDNAKSHSLEDEHVYTYISELGENVIADRFICNDIPFVFLKAKRNIKG